MISHDFDREAWAKLDEFNQMGNIGSEVGRALSAIRQGKKDRVEAAFHRGLDLFDYTAQIWAEAKKPGLKELLYARELFAECISSGKDNPWLEKYFMQFAIAARRGQYS
jgi:hypothetical protein